MGPRVGRRARPDFKHALSHGPTMAPFLLFFALDTPDLLSDSAPLTGDRADLGEYCKDVTRKYLCCHSIAKPQSNTKCSPRPVGAHTKNKLKSLQSTNQTFSSGHARPDSGMPTNAAFHSLLLIRRAAMRLNGCTRHSHPALGVASSSR